MIKTWYCRELSYISLRIILMFRSVGIYIKISFGVCEIDFFHVGLQIPHLPWINPCKLLV